MTINKSYLYNQSNVLIFKRPQIIKLGERIAYINGIHIYKPQEKFQAILFKYKHMYPTKIKLVLQFFDYNASLYNISL